MNSFLSRLKSLFIRPQYRAGWTFYREDKTGYWRWRHVAANGKIVGASTEGFINFIDAVDNAKMNGFVGRAKLTHGFFREVTYQFPCHWTQ